MSDIIIPSSPQDRDKVKNAVKSISDSMTRKEAEDDNIKAVKEDIKEVVGISPKHLMRMAKDFHKREFDKKSRENEEYETLYETVMS